ncbi:uncharacterized protein MYCFIDRAFT_84666 [Pseudocercospora fijiensis CIRAD86]|uniref:F-box domain-containing protein n=1 Tax=Pseudocercospora fijiensis (strain CIRAD86) TaxID=383855 RepID=M2ZNH6_PSEFD|nr:uncharacterized protein MYCFIDRAFT_84666 [Pseudocercospora fijiensis CIRAD86]EME80649.1 hypothetical protein MYCFIDRAFT_84666 [Pseudocercospora fijiensis CIRAD86]
MVIPVVQFTLLLRIYTFAADRKPVNQYPHHSTAIISSPLVKTAQRLFSIAELAENVILRLPMKELLINRRVSKEWRNTIDNSLSIHQKLFLRSAMDSPPHLLVDCRRSKRTIDLAAGECEAYTPEEQSWSIEVRKGVVGNPLFFKPGRERDVFQKAHQYNHAALNIDQAMLNAKLDSSVARMFITFPPVKEVVLS